MKLFDVFEAVSFTEENLIFITNNRYLYYIYNEKYDKWTKYKNAGNVTITVKNYKDISEKNLADAMGGVFPTKETDFMRLCDPSELCIRDMFAILTEDYPDYMFEPDNFFVAQPVRDAIHRFLCKSDICYKSYEKTRELLDNAVACKKSAEEVVNDIKSLSLNIIGKDIFKNKIDIVDGHDSSSYFWIMPVRIIDSTDTDNSENVAEMRSIEISVEEDDVAQYLTPFLYKYFDKNLEANRSRNDADDFGWYLTYNFYTFDAISNILNDIKDTISALSTDRVTEYTAELKSKCGTETDELLYAKGITGEHITEYSESCPTENNTSTELIVDFYRRFVYRMEYMVTVGRENGYNLISFMGP